MNDHTNYLLIIFLEYEFIYLYHKFTHNNTKLNCVVIYIILVRYYVHIWLILGKARLKQCFVNVYII